MVGSQGMSRQTVFERFSDAGASPWGPEASDPEARDGDASLPATGDRPLYRVLSLDGGGIRGLATARVLEEIERQTGKPIGESFDLITGTSAGGMVALALTRPDPNTPGKPLYSARDVAELFSENGGEIFQSKWYSPLTNLFGVRHSRKPLRRVLERFLGDAEVEDATTDILVHTYDLKSQSPVQIRTRKNARDPDERKGQWNYRMADAAMATSAAPTYFKPIDVETIDGPGSPGGRRQTLIDGGIYANNPAVFGLKEAQKIMPKGHEVLVVSVGTGDSKPDFQAEQVKRWGPLSWISPLNGVPILSMVLNAQARGADQVMKTALGDRYVRINADLDDPRLGKDAPDKAFDSASEDNIRRIEAMARLMVKDNQAEIARAADMLETRRYISRDGFHAAFVARNGADAGRRLGLERAGPTQDPDIQADRSPWTAAVADQNARAAPTEAPLPVPAPGKTRSRALQTPRLG